MASTSSAWVLPILATLGRPSGRLREGPVAVDVPPRDVVNSALLQWVFDVDARVMEDPVTGARRVLPNLHVGTRMR